LNKKNINAIIILINNYLNQTQYNYKQAGMTNENLSVSVKSVVFFKPVKTAVFVVSIDSQ
jgi:hypothetical protein